MEEADQCHNTPLPEVLTVALKTGMRRGELLARLWRDVDMLRSVAHLPKTKNGHPRTVPLTPLAVETLRGLPRDDDRVLPIGADAVRHA